LHPLPPDLRLYPFYFDDATGEILEDTTLRPMIATVWYPPERWQVGEIVQTSTLPWEVGSDFGVGLGAVRLGAMRTSSQAVRGDDWSDVEARLPIRVESSELVVRLFDGGTWARLLHVTDGQPVEERRLFDAPPLQHPLHANFADKIRLLGYELDDNSQPAILRQRSGQAHILTLYWQAQQRLDTSYTVFAQLLGPAGGVRAQVDSVPQSGGYPTIWWLPGEIVADTLTLELPPDAPRDRTYRLIVGLYDATNGVRLPVSGTDTDFVELTSLQP
jgi:hypothetical protein